MTVRETRARRPQPGLSRETILEVAETFDLNDLSMPALGAALGVSHAALYHYFPSKQALVAALAEHALSNLQLGDPAGRPWRDLITEAASAMREVLLRYPPYATPHIPASVSSAGFPIGERMCEALTSAGCSEQQALEWSLLIIASCYYSAMQTAYVSEAGLDTEDSRQEYLMSAGITTDSTLHRFMRPMLRTDPQDWFQAMLDRLLDSVVREVAADDDSGASPAENRRVKARQTPGEP